MKVYNVKSNYLELDGKYFLITSVGQKGIVIDTESENGVQISQLIPWDMIKGK